MSEDADWADQITETIVKRVTACRESKSWTVQTLADRCTETGYSLNRTTLSNLENGLRKSITVTELVALARALQVYPEELAPDVAPQPMVGRLLPEVEAGLDQLAVAKLYGALEESRSVNERLLRRLDER